MNLFRLIIIALAVWIAYRIWQNFKTKAKQIPPKNSQQAISDVVACQVCDMHIPENEAFRKGDKVYCSQQHLDSDN